MRNDLYIYIFILILIENMVDGKSILISFSSLDDLVVYMYGFYDSMKIEMNLQFDILPVNIRNYNPKPDCPVQNLNTVESSDAVAQRVTDESIPENMPIATENVKGTLQLQDKRHTVSFAECITKEADYFFRFFSGSCFI